MHVDVARSAERATRRPQAIVVRRGLPTSARLPFDDVDPDRELVIGRQEGCDLTVVDPAVSRRHVAVRRDGTRVRFRDLGSRNGVVVRGKPEREGELGVGDVFLIGADGADRPCRLILASARLN